MTTMANQSDRRDGSAMQQHNTQTTVKSGTSKNKTNPQYKGDKNSDKSGKGGKGGCC